MLAAEHWIFPAQAAKQSGGFHAGGSINGGRHFLTSLIVSFKLMSVLAIWIKEITTTSWFDQLQLVICSIWICFLSSASYNKSPKQQLSTIQTTHVLFIRVPWPLLHCGFFIFKGLIEFQPSSVIRCLKWQTHVLYLCTRYREKKHKNLLIVRTSQQHCLSAPMWKSDDKYCLNPIWLSPRAVRNVLLDVLQQEHDFPKQNMSSSISCYGT